MLFGRTGRLVVLCGMVIALMPAVRAMAAIDAYMTIEGSRQGKIKGGDMKTAGTEQIRLTDVVRESPSRDAASGMASGKRQHGTITIMKEIDKASPMLFQALSSNEVLTNVVIVFPGGSSRTEKGAQKIDLGDAVITNIQKVGTGERITLTYQKIEVTYMNGNKSAQDAWDAK
jgi:type VI secretion system secreted protein Hcp